VGWHDPDTRRLVPVTVAGDPEGYIASMSVYTDSRPEGLGPSGTAFRERRPYVSNDILGDSATKPWAAVIDARGLRAVAVFPIYEKSEPRGVLVVYSLMQGFFKEEEVALLAAAASDLSFALDNQARAAELETQRARLAQAQAVLQSAAERNRELAAGLTTTLESITDAFYTLNTFWRFTYVNHEAERLLRRPRSELLGRNIWELFPELEASEIGRELHRAAVEHVSTQSEAFYAPLGGWFEVRSFPSSQGLAVYFRDITSRRRSAEQLRALALKLESVQEAERSAIAREVHDELGQALTALRMDASRLSRMVSGQPDAAALVSEMTAAIDASLKEARSIATALHPTALDDLGIVAAIELHVTQVARRAGLKAELALDPVWSVDRARSGAVYRVLQESLTNVVRHAQATAVSVRLTASESEVVLTVDDDGRGIEPRELERTGSLGLLGMRERAAAFHGTIAVTRREPRGTRVTLRLPLESLE